MALTLKVVKSDTKIIVLIRKSKFAAHSSLTEKENPCVALIVPFVELKNVEPNSQYENS